MIWVFMVHTSIDTSLRPLYKRLTLVHTLNIYLSNDLLFKHIHDDLKRGSSRKAPRHAAIFSHLVRGGKVHTYMINLPILVGLTLKTHLWIGNSSDKFPSEFSSRFQWFSHSHFHSKTFKVSFLVEFVFLVCNVFFCE